MDKRKWIHCSVAAAAMFASATSLAGDLIGAYVGAGVGQSQISYEGNGVPNFVSLASDHHFGAWQAFVGIRPISVIGLELDYIDFGNASPSPSGSTLFGTFEANLKQSATALFAVGYLPIPLPLVDVYGKLGVARFQSNAQESYTPPSCPASFDCNIPSSVAKDLSHTDLAYGIGAQAHFASVAVRAEYQRINASGGNPQLFAIGVAWLF